MNSKLRLAISGIVALLVVFFLFGSSEEDKIKSQLQTMQQLADVNGAEQRLDMLSVAKELSEGFVENAIFDFSNAGYSSYEMSSRQELSQQILMARSRLSKLETNIKFLEINVSGKEAFVTVKASALGATKGRAEQFLEMHEVKVRLTKSDGNWLIEKVEHLKNLRDKEGL